MNFFNKIVSFFKKILKKDSSIKRIEEPKFNTDVQKQKSEFKDSIKVQLIEKKNKIETLICTGDGLRNTR